MTFRRIVQIEEDKRSKIYNHEAQLKVVKYEEEPTSATEGYKVVSLTKSAGQVNPISVQRQNEQQIPRPGKRKREHRDDELELDLHLENIRRVRITTVS
jgi:hypothetical protein